MHVASWWFLGMHVFWWVFWAALLLWAYRWAMAMVKRLELQGRETPLEVLQRRYAAGDGRGVCARARVDPRDGRADPGSASPRNAGG